jgi:nicotinamidase-related amidase
VKAARVGTALVLIDLQQGLVAGVPPVHGADGLLGRLRQLAVDARKAGVPVVHVLDDDVADVLRTHDVEHLVVGGCVTEACVDSTCRHAVLLGYDVTLVGDGHSTTAAGSLSAEAIIEHHHRILDGYGAYVRGLPREIRVLPASGIDFADIPASVTAWAEARGADRTTTAPDSESTG